MLPATLASQDSSEEADPARGHGLGLSAQSCPGGARNRTLITEGGSGQGQCIATFTRPLLASHCPTPSLRVSFRRERGRSCVLELLRGNL